MGGKKKKKGKKKGKKGKKKSVGGKKGKGKCAIVRAPIDIMGADAMENAYYMCHNAADCLRDRGFPWPMAKKGKKKK